MSLSVKSKVKFGKVMVDLTGTLHKGDSLSTWFVRRTNTATINLVETEIVPLPGAVLLGMIGLSIAGVKLRKHA